MRAAKAYIPITIPSSGSALAYGSLHNQYEQSSALSAVNSLASSVATPLHHGHVVLTHPGR